MRQFTKEEDDEWNRLLNWHWDPSQLEKQGPPPQPLPPQTVFDLHKREITETWEERITRMLVPMSAVVRSCSMCTLGRKVCLDHNTVFDPHVFSNMKPSKWMVIGQNPGFNETLEGVPFVGEAGKNFANQLKKYGIYRDQFYISNIVKCYTIGNEKPAHEHVAACEPFLRMELNLIRPLLVITLGQVAFDALCPDLVMSKNLNEIVKSTKFGVSVFPLYHPSGRNMSDAGRKKCFDEGVDTLCQLIKAYKAKHADD